MLTGFILSALTALFWTGLDISRKKLIRNVTTWGAVAGLTAFQLPMLAAIIGAGEVLQLEGAIADVVLAGVPEALSLDYWLFALATVLLNLLANYLFFRSVDVSPLSLTIPYLSFTPVFSAFTGLLFLGEVPDSWGWIGIVVVTFGAFFLNPGNPDEGVFAPVKALRSELGSLYMVVVAMLWSLSPVIDKLATEQTSPVWHTAMIALGMSSSIIAYRLATDDGDASVFSELADQWKLFVLCAVLNMGAMILQLAAYAYIEVAYVETVKRAIGVIGAMVAGYLLFDERDIARRIFGGLVMIAGVALILL